MMLRALQLSCAVAATAVCGTLSAADPPPGDSGKSVSAWIGSVAKLPAEDKNAIGRDLVIDGPGKATRVRVVAIVDGKSVEERRNATLDSLIRAADKDGNGKLNGEEFGATLKEEFERKLGGRLPPGADSESFLSGYQETDEVSIDELRSQLNLDLGPLLEVVVQPQPLVDRLELFAALDADGDSFVAAAELAESERLFAKYDADGDGTLNQPELAPTEPLQPTPIRSGARFPPGRFPFHWEDPFVGAEVDAVVEIKLIGRAFGRPKVTVAEKSDGLAVTAEARKASFDLAGIGLDLDASPARITSEDVKRFYLLQLRQRDADKNGYLSEAEFAGLGLPGLDYRAADVDGDGMLFPKELSERLDALIARESSRVRVEATFERQPLFTKLDTDGDGRLSRREMRDAGKVLASADVDGDGRIGLAEFGGRYRLSFGVPNPLDGANPRMVADIEAMTRTPSPRATGGPAWFSAMDRNADGDLTRREFLGKADLFAKFDADGDGLLSPEESVAAEGGESRDESPESREETQDSGGEGERLES